MWLSNISPLRAGTVGSLSDNNLAEINVPIFASSVNRFLTLSSKRTIFGGIYSFIVHDFVISTKFKQPLAVQIPPSYTEIEARPCVKNHEGSSKAMWIRSFLFIPILSSCPTMPSGCPKTSAGRPKSGFRTAIHHPKSSGQPVISGCPRPKTRCFCSDIRTYSLYQPDIRTHPVFSGFLCGTHRNTFVVFPTWSECLSEVLYMPYI